MSDTDKKLTPPYVPYKTFNTFLSHLKAIGMPSHIDKAAMASMSGGMQSWLRSALRYMKLIDAEGRPTESMRTLVSTDANTPERKVVIANLFRETYAFLDGKVDLANTTPGRLRAAFIEQGGSGSAETIDKAVAFLVAMAKDGDITLHKLLTTRMPGQRRPKNRPSPSRPSTTGVDEEPEEEDELDQPGMAKTIGLPRSGGTLTLSGNLNLFELVGAERDLVFALIDSMRAFEEAQKGDEE